MRFITHRSRIHYWSSSRLSKALRNRFGLENPKWNTLEGWDDHHEGCQKKAPIVHWITDKGFDKLQDIWLFIPDVIWTIRTATVWKLFRTFWKFRKALWNYRSWDYGGLLMFMETAARDMSKCQKENGIALRSDRTAHELKVWAELLKRIREDNWTEDKLDFVKTGKKSIFGGWEHVQKPNTLPNYKHAKTFNHIERSVQKHQLELAAKMFQTKVKHWWD